MDQQIILFLYEEDQCPRNKNEKNTMIKDLSRVEAADEVEVVGVLVVVLVLVVDVVVVGFA